ncbi:uncharacterized protein Tco025E_03531 [Trypanosoma conorhini]|uniref:Uncharacterized protein n=1 Tax=Trypanosoma conorhini TaxID=83891 RepID=A0A3R7L726_9TRYP|nr:uncharacterized protein Tco025E_03531 [Trypanosoma conorhini]RNF21078.1 hypothetical protein Tco025E_03531 [Trypanosoma conorhini]
MQENDLGLTHTSSAAAGYVVCDQPLAVVNEDYAVLGGVLGGLLLAAVYVLTLKIIDLCYRREHRRGLMYNEAPSPFGQPRPMTQLPPGRSASVVRQGSIGSAGGGGAFSPRSSAQRRVHFDAESVDRAGNATALDPRAVEEPALDAGGSDGRNEAEWSYARGGVYGEFPSPPPTLPPRQ